jgi:hypothetical protein
MRPQMDLKIRDQVKSLLWGFPITGNYLLNRYLEKHLSNEIKLIQGCSQSKSDHRSIIHFSVNKAATQYVRDLLMRCAMEIGLVPIGLAEYAFHTNFPYLDDLSTDEMGDYQYLFKPTGYLYSVFGGMIEGIHDFEKYSVILMIRDPRDVLVSEYYSYAYSHSEPSRLGNKFNDFMEKRRKARELTISEYALTECDRVYDNYQRYMDLLLNNRSNVYVTRYEDMTNDWSGWFDKLLDFCKLEISYELLMTLSKEAARLKPSQENIHQHNRKGIPGDYAEKLDRQTINVLNSRFSSVLEKFNYSR